MRDFSSYSRVKFPGQLQKRPLTGFAAPANAVPAVIDWNAIQAAWVAQTGSPSLTFSVDCLLNASVGGTFLLNQLRSIYVDNSDNFFPVWVYFPDTGISLGVPENSCRTLPALTAGLEAYVCAQLPTITDLIIGGAGVVPTLVVFSDAPLPMQDASPYPSAVSMLMGSGPTLVSQNIINEAAGEQMLIGSVSLSVPGQTLSPVGFGPESVVCVVQSLSIFLTGLRASTTWELDWVCGDHGTIPFSGVVPAGYAGAIEPLINISGAQMRVQNQNSNGMIFRCNSVTTAGTAYIVMGYSVINNV